MDTVQPISSRKTGELARLLEERQRGDSDFQLLIEHPDEVVALVDVIKAREMRVLEDITTVKVPEISSFDAEAHFVVTPKNERKNAEVLIGWMGDNAQRLVKDFVEPAVAEATLRVYQLTRASLDGPIIAELGGKEVVITTWGRMWEMMRRQGRGQQGILPTDGRATIFYIPDPDGVLWAAYCDWSSYYAGWDVEAGPVTSPYRWLAGNQVVSR